jgi:hypothetical protein
VMTQKHLEKKNSKIEIFICFWSGAVIQLVDQ